jgi:ABC-type oligopeptide transport system substrate-binding subunit
MKRKMFSTFFAAVLACFVLTGCTSHASSKISPNFFKNMQGSTQSENPIQIEKTKKGVVIYKDNEGFSDDSRVPVQFEKSTNVDVKFGPSGVDFGPKE